MKKCVVVTGSSRGIGLRLIEKLSDNGNTIIAISRDIAPIEALKRKHIYPIAIDLTVETAYQAVINCLNEYSLTIDALVHNAGQLILSPFEQTTTADFQQVYQVNVFAVAALTRRLLPYIKKGGHVLAISSMGGIQGSVKFADLAAYSSSKGAVITLMEVLSEVYKDKGINFNTLALGSVQTQMFEDAFPNVQAASTPEDIAKYISNFVENDYKLFNGKTIQVANNTP